MESSINNDVDHLPMEAGILKNPDVFANRFIDPATGFTYPSCIGIDPDQNKFGNDPNQVRFGDFPTGFIGDDPNQNRIGNIPLQITTIARGEIRSGLDQSKVGYIAPTITTVITGQIIGGEPNKITYGSYNVMPDGNIIIHFGAYP